MTPERKNNLRAGFADGIRPSRASMYEVLDALDAAEATITAATEALEAALEPKEPCTLQTLAVVACAMLRSPNVEMEDRIEDLEEQRNEAIARSRAWLGKYETERGLRATAQAEAGEAWEDRDAALSACASKDARIDALTGECAAAEARIQEQDTTNLLLAGKYDEARARIRDLEANASVTEDLIGNLRASAQIQDEIIEELKAQRETLRQRVIYDDASLALECNCNGDFWVWGETIPPMPDSDAVKSALEAP